MPMPRIISRYIVRQFLMSFFAVMLALGFVVVLFDVIELMKKATLTQRISRHRQSVCWEQGQI